MRQLTLRWIWVAVTIGFAVTGCRKEPRDQSVAGDSAEVPNRSAATAPHEHDTIDPGKGVWTTQAVIGALRSRGLGPVTVYGPIRIPFLGPSGTRLHLPQGEIQVYVYADALARARETDLIDSITVAPIGRHVDWRLPPSIISVNNAALIVLTRDSAFRKRVHAAVRLHE